MHAKLNFLLLFAVLVAPVSVYGQNFTATLNGAQEVPAVVTTGAGSATVSVSGNLLTINVTFTGLSGPSVNTFIHCCGPAGTNDPVAIQLPGFPAATAGTYTQTFDLTNLATYIPAFVAANGGTAASAEAALLAGLNAGNAYVNLHTAANPGGEIRGQLALAPAAQDGPFQIGYAANLNIGDSVVNISNDGFNGGVFGAGLAGTAGNICANVYVFDPREEEIGCCACLVSPNGLEALSAKSDLISNNLTPDVPTSIVIKLVASRPVPATAAAGAPLTVCNPALVGTTPALAPIFGMLAWGTTLEPESTPGTYNAVSVRYLNGNLAANGTVGVAAAVGTEINAMSSLCNFIQSNGSGFGICKSCRLGALGGAKQ